MNRGSLLLIAVAGLWWSAPAHACKCAPLKPGTSAAAYAKDLYEAADAIAVARIALFSPPDPKEGWFAPYVYQLEPVEVLKGDATFKTIRQGTRTSCELQFRDGETKLVVVTGNSASFCRNRFAFPEATMIEEFRRLRHDQSKAAHGNSGR